MWFWRTRSLFSRGWPWLLLIFIVGIALASPRLTEWVSRQSWGALDPDSAREVGAALAGGAVVGLALLLVEQQMLRAERERLRARRFLDAYQRRENQARRVVARLHDPEAIVEDGELWWRFTVSVQVYDAPSITSCEVELVTPDWWPMQQGSALARASIDLTTARAPGGTVVQFRLPRLLLSTAPTLALGVWIDDEDGYHWVRDRDGRLCLYSAAGEKIPPEMRAELPIEYLD
jgi:hypothetical protein